ncbi:hypothetical protein NI456_11235 [Brevundimonas diminuta]|uniref:hypothetical protein n=1 Tax=Brevundimonas diminuta TaxID=293 RepID=UPI0020983788|nr:hypothetical protein [Brevundimonas diminuta]MCO8019430.1 hypothetical protein [Brevundimonas diminuta]MCO8022108.1 hypothetical protein [Brevundimonas diminuta]
MQVLLDIDPDADKDRTLSVGLEEAYGIPAKEMNSLGKETLLNLSILKKHYDALGSIPPSGRK